MPSLNPRIDNHPSWDASMKKILSIIVTLFLGVISSFASADTNYNFTFTGNGGNATGVFTVDDSGNQIIDIRGSMSGFPVGNDFITGILPIGGFDGNNNAFTSFTPYVSNAGTGFYAGSNFNLYTMGTGSTDWYIEYELADIYPASQGMLEVTAATVVPEMDASLIPQVGLLLGCLFLLFGRKKEFTEPMLTA